MAVSPKQVPAGGCFVLGDNRNNSHDSRFVGAVPADNIKGTAHTIRWSGDHARIGQMIR